MANEAILNGRYRLIATQGSGGMAVIYKAIDLALGRTVAVKALRPSLTSDPSFLDRFRNEARSIANLTHPNIVTVYDVGSYGDTHYIVMEYVDGQDLKKIIRTEGALPVDRALHLAIQICDGMGFAHRAGLVHADVKPQNILVTKEDVVKVTDFGIAQVLTDTTNPGEKQSVVWGSPHYFAPEQAKGERPTPASDVYAIGIVMFEMLTGRLPYMGATQQELALAHIRDQVPSVTDFNPSVPDNLSRIISKVMSKEPSARYRTADQLGQILRTYRDRARQNTAYHPSGTNVQPPNSPAVPPWQQSGAAPAQQVSQPQPSLQQPPPLPFSQGQPPASSGYPSPTQQPPLPFSQSQPPVPPGQPGLTERYNVAPVAPQPSPYAKPSQGAAPPWSPQQPPSPPSSLSGSDSRPLRYEAPSYGESEPDAGGMDIVTIVLAILAFLAVACLIPLYIAVFQARFGG
jgi:eukaryotic-like serine/threonine-protein kinase